MNEITMEVEAAIQAAMRELKFAIAEAEQQVQQRLPPTLNERTALYRRRAQRIVDAYVTGLANTTAPPPDTQ